MTLIRIGHHYYDADMFEQVDDDAQGNLTVTFRNGRTLKLGTAGDPGKSLLKYLQDTAKDVKIGGSGPSTNP